MKESGEIWAVLHDRKALAQGKTEKREEEE